MEWSNDLKVIGTCICKASSKLRERDGDLLEIGANERSLTHRFAIYLEEEINQSVNWVGKWHVDCEYNRDVACQKVLLIPTENVSSDDLEARTVYPDIIVHRRTEQGAENNLLVIEAKKGAPSLKDLAKLKGFVSLSDNYRYRFGLFLGFGHSGIERVILYEADKGLRDTQSDRELQELFNLSSVL